MIDSKINDGIAMLTLMHGKANALDIEFCEALAAKFLELRTSGSKAVVLTGQGPLWASAGRAGAPCHRTSVGRRAVSERGSSSAGVAHRHTLCLPGRTPRRR